MKCGFLGIDVSKVYSDFIAINAQSEELTKPFKLFDNREGHKKMLLRILKLKHEFNLDTSYCGVESTGSYENNWYRTLAAQGSDNIYVVRINPIATHHESKSEMNRIVNDVTAARTIANHLKSK